jgi:hypothetical protein
VGLGACLIESARGGKYVDAHCWVFMPSSFLILVAACVELNLLTPFICANFFETEPGTNEMIVILRRIDDKSKFEKQRAKESFLTHLKDLRFSTR